MLSGNSLKALVDIWDGHCWVDVDGVFVDITATQFSGDFPSVFVVAPDDDDRCRYRPDVQSPSLSGWPDYQQPNDLLRELVLSRWRERQDKN